MEIEGEDAHEEEEKKNQQYADDAERARQRVEAEYMASWSLLELPRVSHPFGVSGVGSPSSSSPSSIYFNEFTGCISALHPSRLEVMDEVRGGILAEEMGQTKTNREQGGTEYQS